MKVQLADRDTGFRPVVLTITLESVEEVQALYKLTGWNGSAAALVVNNGGSPYGDIERAKEKDAGLFEHVIDVLLNIRDALELIAEVHK